jgi:hypothetical protein
MGIDLDRYARLRRGHHGIEATEEETMKKTKTFQCIRSVVAAAGVTRAARLIASAVRSGGTAIGASAGAAEDATALQEGRQA